jgi:2'-5' RNA ligase
MSSDTYRLFIAISLPERVKDEIEKAQNELRGAVPEGSVRWTKRGQLHLTLKFLGDVEAQRLEALASSLARACEQSGALRLLARRIDFFPGLRHPRVVWVGVDDVPERLPVLRRTVEAATAGFTGEEPEKTFTGHVTLGRCKAIKRPQAEILAKAAKTMEQRFFGEWTADRIEIIRSELGSGGSRYTTLFAVSLAAETGLVL